jgi:hypothetical protein
VSTEPRVLVDPTPEQVAALPPGVYAVATVVHPDREFTPEERAHLGLPPIAEQESTS